MDDKIMGIVKKYLDHERGEFRRFDVGEQDYWGNGCLAASDGYGGDVLLKIIVRETDGKGANFTVDDVAREELRRAMFTFCDETGADEVTGDYVIVVLRDGGRGSICHLANYQTLTFSDGDAA